MTGRTLSSQEAQCRTCGSDWRRGEYDPACATCGGGALSRSCPLCGGSCRTQWTRAVLDSNDAGTAHWLGHCEMADDTSETGATDELWLDEAALPERLACVVTPLGSSLIRVTDCDGVVHVFATRGVALAWLAQEGFVPASEIGDD